MNRLPSIFFCAAALFIVSCKKSDSPDGTSADFVLTAPLAHFPNTTAYLQGDTSFNQLEWTVAGNRAQTWKTKDIGNQHFLILASDLPGFALHVGQYIGPHAARLPESPDESFQFYLSRSNDNTITIQSVSTLQYLYLTSCQKKISSGWETWSGGGGFTPDITHCNAVDPGADSCYCVFSFRFVRK